MLRTSRGRRARVAGRRALGRRDGYGLIRRAHRREDPRDRSREIDPMELGQFVLEHLTELLPEVAPKGGRGLAGLSLDISALDGRAPNHQALDPTGQRDLPLGEKRGPVDDLVGQAPQRRGRAQ